MRAAFSPHRALGARPVPFTNSPLSFSFADTLPSQSWEPPPQTLLQLDDTPPEEPRELALSRVEQAWAPTQRLGL